MTKNLFSFLPIGDRVLVAYVSENGNVNKDRMLPKSNRVLKKVMFDDNHSETDLRKLVKIILQRGKRKVLITTNEARGK